MKLHPACAIFLLLAPGRAVSLFAEDEKPAASPTRAAAADAQPVEKAKEAAVDPLDAQATQYLQMLYPKMWRELESIRQSCDLAPEQRPKVRAAAESSVKVAARNLAQQMRRGNQTDPGVTIRKDLNARLESILTREQLAAFQEQAAHRASALKKASILVVVAQLDTALYLTREQREKITQTIDASWQDDWESWIMIGQYGGRYLPMMPDKLVTPHINDQQKTVWRGMQKVNLGFWGGNTMERPADESWWEGKEEADKPKAEAKGVQYIGEAAR